MSYLCSPIEIQRANAKKNFQKYFNINLEVRNKGFTFAAPKGSVERKVSGDLKLIFHYIYINEASDSASL